MSCQTSVRPRILSQVPADGHFANPRMVEVQTECPCRSSEDLQPDISTCPKRIRHVDGGGFSQSMRRVSLQRRSYPHCATATVRYDVYRPCPKHVACKERRYDEVMEAWRTSCPKLPVCEKANEAGLLPGFAQMDPRSSGSQRQRFLSVGDCHCTDVGVCIFRMAARNAVVLERTFSILRLV